MNRFFSQNGEYTAHYQVGHTFGITNFLNIEMIPINEKKGHIKRNSHTFYSLYISDSIAGSIFIITNLYMHFNHIYYAFQLRLFFAMFIY